MLAVALSGTLNRGRDRGMNKGSGRGDSGGRGAHRSMESSIGPNQCAYCRKEGIWRRKCPQAAEQLLKRGCDS